MKPPRTIKIMAEDVETMIKELSLIIVSMDRLGSTYYDDSIRRAAETDKFFLKVGAFKRLAAARAILSKAYDGQSSPAEVAKLEENAEQMPYWGGQKGSGLKSL